MTVRPSSKTMPARCARWEGFTCERYQGPNSLPIRSFAISLIVLWLSAWSGALFFRKRRALNDDEREDFGIVQTLTLTLLALIIGFSFSMAVNRYDLRKNYEEAEANAIGTQYVRAALLPTADAAKVRELLISYLAQRLLFYGDANAHQLQQVNSYTAELQADLWSAVEVPAMANPKPVMALAVSGMNDVLNSQGYTQASYWNRLPMSNRIKPIIRLIRGENIPNPEIIPNQPSRLLKNSRFTQSNYRIGLQSI